MYELNKHKRSDAIKWAIVFVSILVIITVVLAILSSGFRNWDVTTWFGQKDETEQTDKDKNNVPVVDGDGNEMTSDKVYPMPDSMAFSPLLYNANTATYSTSSVTVSATIEPANATEQGVNWSVAFKDPASEWATGKSVTDYVTLNTADKNATVVCKAAFGEQIILTAASVENMDIKATCTVDYVKPVTILSVNKDGGIYQNAGIDTPSGYVTISPANNDKDNISVFSFQTEYGIGTLDQDFEMSASVSTYKDMTLDLLVERGVVEKHGSYTSSVTSTNFANLSLNFNNTFLNAMYGQIRNVSEFVSVHPDQVSYSLTFNVTPEYGSVTAFVMYLSIDVDKINVPVTGITLDKDGLIIDGTSSLRPEM